MSVSPGLMTALKPVHRMSLISWTVMTLLVVAFVVLVYTSLRETDPSLSEPVYLIVPLTLLTLFLTSISLVLKWYVTSKRRIRLRVRDAGKATRNAAANSCPADLLAVRLYKMYRLQRFIALTLHVAITLYGVVLSFTYGRPYFILPYATLALVLNVVWFPRYRFLVAQIRKHWDADGGAPPSRSGRQNGI